MGENVTEQMRLQELVNDRGKIKQQVLYGSAYKFRLVCDSDTAKLIPDRDRSNRLFNLNVFDITLFTYFDDLHQFTKRIQATREARMWQEPQLNSLACR